MSKERFIQGWSFEDKPKHNIFCNTCKNLFTDVTHTRKGLKYSDIYENCTKIASEETNYILNHSDESGNYHSGVNLKGLIANKIAQSHGWFNK